MYVCMSFRSFKSLWDDQPWPFTYKIKGLWFFTECTKVNEYLKGIKPRDCRNFGPFLRKTANYKIAKLSTIQIWDSLFPNIWSKYDIDTHILDISTYGNEIRISVTLITIAFITNTREI